jgi:uncharacterized paraquat-inducible protein A
MSGIKDIIKSWWTSFNPNEEQSKEAQRRLEICNSCDKRQESVVFGYICGQCGCPLGKKIFSSDKQPCPLNKW